MENYPHIILNIFCDFANLCSYVYSCNEKIQSVFTQLLETTKKEY